MPKGLFTQSAVILLERPLGVAALADCLRDFEPVQQSDAGRGGWMDGPALVLALRPVANGWVLVDELDRPWPDQLGDPQHDPQLFAAWSMGWFGPFSYPSSLSRANAMSFAWEEAAEVTARHRAFLRIQTSYALGGDADTKDLPPDYAPLAELEFVTTVARAALELPGALAYFNPNGEVLRAAAGLDEELAWHRDLELPPLPVWSNVRLFQLSSEWSLMDTIGMEQLDVDDHEACFRTGDYAPQDVDSFLRNATDFVRENGPVIEDGNTMDGPGGVRWVAKRAEESLAPRPRRVLRWFPQDGSRLPTALLKQPD